MLRFLTAGESHGECLTGIIEGLPKGLGIDISFINDQLRRRQSGHGRGGRMKIEQDGVHITSGVRHGFTLGSPIAFTISNKDWEQWRIPMSLEPQPPGSDLAGVRHPRPGHADLAGVLKYQTRDVRDILERASARETAARVVVGAICKIFLQEFGIRIGSHTLALGAEQVGEDYMTLPSQKILDLDPEVPLHCADAEAAKRMMRQIDDAGMAGDTLGGIAEIVAAAVPPGLGSHVHWDRRLDGRIAQALMSIPSVKAVEVGIGVSAARQPGSRVHDAIFYDSQRRRFFRSTNNAGGIEGGITNGEDLRLRIYVKPVPTLRDSLPSVDVESKEACRASTERSDVCVVPATGVIGEAMLGIILADAFIEKFGADTLKEIKRNYDAYQRDLDEY